MTPFLNAEIALECSASPGSRALLLEPMPVPLVEHRASPRARHGTAAQSFSPRQRTAERGGVSARTEGKGQRGHREETSPGLEMMPVPAMVEGKGQRARRARRPHGPGQMHGQGHRPKYGPGSGHVDGREPKERTSQRQKQEQGQRHLYGPGSWHADGQGPKEWSGQRQKQEQGLRRAQTREALALEAEQLLAQLNALSRRTGSRAQHAGTDAPKWSGGGGEQGQGGKTYHGSTAYLDAVACVQVRSTCVGDVAIAGGACQRQVPQSADRPGRVAGGPTLGPLHSSASVASSSLFSQQQPGRGVRDQGEPATVIPYQPGEGSFQQQRQGSHAASRVPSNQALGRPGNVGLEKHPPPNVGGIVRSEAFVAAMQLRAERRRQRQEGREARRRLLLQKQQAQLQQHFSQLEREQSYWEEEWKQDLQVPLLELEPPPTLKQRMRLHAKAYSEPFRVRHPHPTAPPCCRLCAEQDCGGQDKGSLEKPLERSASCAKPLNTAQDVGKVRGKDRERIGIVPSGAEEPSVRSRTVPEGGGVRRIRGWKSWDVVGWEAHGRQYKQGDEGPVTREAIYAQIMAGIAHSQPHERLHSSRSSASPARRLYPASPRLSKASSPPALAFLRSYLGVDVASRYATQRLGARDVWSRGSSAEDGKEGLQSDDGRREERGDEVAACAEGTRAFAVTGGDAHALALSGAGAEMGEGAKSGAGEGADPAADAVPYVAAGLGAGAIMAGAQGGEQEGETGAGAEEETGAGAGKGAKSGAGVHAGAGKAPGEWGRARTWAGEEGRGASTPCTRSFSERQGSSSFSHTARMFQVEAPHAQGSTDADARQPSSRLGISADKGTAHGPAQPPGLELLHAEKTEEAAALEATSAADEGSGKLQLQEEDHHSPANAPRDCMGMKGAESVERMAKGRMVGWVHRLGRRLARALRDSSPSLQRARGERLGRGSASRRASLLPGSVNCSGEQMASTGKGELASNVVSGEEGRAGESKGSWCSSSQHEYARVPQGCTSDGSMDAAGAIEAHPNDSIASGDGQGVADGSSNEERKETSNGVASGVARAVHNSSAQPSSDCDGEMHDYSTGQTRSEEEPQSSRASRPDGGSSGIDGPRMVVAAGDGGALQGAHPASEQVSVSESGAQSSTAEDEGSRGRGNAACPPDRLPWRLPLQFMRFPGHGQKRSPAKPHSPVHPQSPSFFPSPPTCSSITKMGPTAGVSPKLPEEDAVAAPGREELGGGRVPWKRRTWDVFGANGVWRHRAMVEPSRDAKAAAQHEPGCLVQSGQPGQVQFTRCSCTVSNSSHSHSQGLLLAEAPQAPSRLSSRLSSRWSRIMGEVAGEEVAWHRDGAERVASVSRRHSWSAGMERRRKGGEATAAMSMCQKASNVVLGEGTGISTVPAEGVAGDLVTGTLDQAGNASHEDDVAAASSIGTLAQPMSAEHEEGTLPRSVAAEAAAGAPPIVACEAAADEPGTVGSPPPSERAIALDPATAASASFNAVARAAELSTLMPPTVVGCVEGAAATASLTQDRAADLETTPASTGATHQQLASAEQSDQDRLSNDMSNAKEQQGTGKVDSDLGALPYGDLCPPQRSELQNLGKRLRGSGAAAAGRQEGFRMAPECVRPDSAAAANWSFSDWINKGGGGLKCTCPECTCPQLGSATS